MSLAGDLSNLPDFLLARIAEDEEAANAFAAPEGADEDPAAWMVSKAADRMLAECDAKRRIVARYVRAAALAGKHPHAEAAEGALRGVLLDLALPYAEHPDYRQEWRS